MRPRANPPDQFPPALFLPLFYVMLLFALAGVATSASAAVQGVPVTAPAAAGQALRIGGVAMQGGLLKGVAPPGTLSLAFDGRQVPLAPDGRFIIGLDRDQAETGMLVATLAGGVVSRREIRVAPRSWRIQNVNVARRPGGPSEDFVRRRSIEVARIEAARSVNAPASGWRQQFILPTRGRISGHFGAQRIYRGEPAAYHSGLDIAPGAGALVLAPADGTVVLAGPPMFSLEGNLVIIDHGLGLNSAFLHLASTQVVQGQEIRQGDPIGTVGATGRATGPHLHWSVKWKDARLDPILLVGDQAVN